MWHSVGLSTFVCLKSTQLGYLFFILNDQPLRQVVKYIYRWKLLFHINDNSQISLVIKKINNIQI